ncbi:MAG: hypothetical protein E7257_09920 [Lachnospiraceae bacterium]|nr:hypothetical protein [Lachnospiraceae bacterium]
MVNKFQYTEDLIKEGMKKNISIKAYILVLISILYGSYIVIKGLEQNVLKVFGIIFPLVVIFLLIIKINQSINIAIKQAYVTYGKLPIEMTVIIKDNIEVITSESRRTISLDNVKSYKISENLITITLDAYLMVFVKKDSFVEGTCQECIALLDNICK